MRRIIFLASAFSCLLISRAFGKQNRTIEQNSFGNQLQLLWPRGSPYWIDKGAINDSKDTEYRFSLPLH